MPREKADSSLADSVWNDKWHSPASCAALRRRALRLLYHHACTCYFHKGSPGVAELADAADSKASSVIIGIIPTVNGHNRASSCNLLIPLAPGSRLHFARSRPRRCRSAQRRHAPQLHCGADPRNHGLGLRALLAREAVRRWRGWMEQGFFSLGSLCPSPKNSSSSRPPWLLSLGCPPHNPLDAPGA